MLNKTDPTQTKNINCLIYGRPGVGKTTLVSTAQEVPEMKNLLIVDCAGGMASISDKEQIDVVQPESFKDLKEVYVFLKKHIEAEDDLLEVHEEHFGESLDEPKIYRTLVIDTLTELQNNCMDLIREYDPDLEDDLTAVKSPVKRRNWGQLYKTMLDMVREFKALNCNFLVTSWASKDDDGQVGPAISGSLYDDLPGFFDLVGYLTVKEGDRKLLTSKTRRFEAKDRLNVIEEDVVTNPTMQDLVGDYLSNN